MKKPSLAKWMKIQGYPFPQIQISNSFLAARKVGKVVYVSSATPLRFNSKEIIGKIGKEVNLDLAKEAACLCLAHSLSLLNSIVDNPLEIELNRVVDLTFMMNCVPEFGDHSLVADAASNLLIDYFGEAGKHSRSALGAGSIVRNCSVVLKGIYELK